MNKQELARLISRFKAGTASREEIELLERFWNKSVNDSSFTDSLSEKELDETRASILGRVKESDRNVRKLSPVTQFSLLKVAAAVSLLMVASILLYLNSTNRKTISTGFGEQLTIALPDGSSVVLNGNSMLSYKEDWDENADREVWIEGEGFFSVRHFSNDQRFVVHASDQLDVEVLGTKFNVKSRNNTSQVMLTEGKVKLDLSDDTETSSLYLKPNELAVATNQGLSKQVVKKEYYTSWLDNKLVLDKTTLNEVAKILNETYGLEVEFEQEDLRSRTLSGEVSSATADDILYAIAETLDVSVRKEGRSVSIAKKEN